MYSIGSDLLFSAKRVCQNHPRDQLVYVILYILRFLNHKTQGMYCRKLVRTRLQTAELVNSGADVSWICSHTTGVMTTLQVMYTATRSTPVLIRKGFSQFRTESTIRQLAITLTHLQTENIYRLIVVLGGESFSQPS